MLNAFAALFSFKHKRAEADTKLIIYMKKVLFMFIGMILTFPVAWGSSGDGTAIKIHCKSGDDVIIMLDEHPEVYFNFLDLTISTDNNVIYIQSAEAKKITYLNAGTDGLVTPGVPDAVFSFDKESLSVRNLSPLTEVSVYTIDGRLVSSATSDADGNATICLPVRSASVYIIKTPFISFKLRRP